MIITDKSGKVVFTEREKGFDLGGRDIPEANMRGLNLRSADFKKSNMRNSDLSISDIESANFTRADAGGSDFTRANCNSAIFWGAGLTSCNFQEADLSNANFARADLTDADLTGAKIDGAIFLHTNLTNVTGLYQFNILPVGDIVGWKKLRDNKIAKLLIPASANRINPLGGRICRADYADVLEIEGGAKTGAALRDVNFIYEVGKPVTPREAFDDDIRDRHSSGINFFLTRDEAVNW